MHSAPAGNAPPNERNRSMWSRTLPAQMLAGLAIGCAIGFAFPTFGKQLQPLSQAFIQALRLIVIPLVFSSITLGIYNMGREIAVLGRIVGIAFAWFFFATGVCMTWGW
jgi:DAACS family dicarboxylate/amino acid:cation (Na+ or H+) symporter